MDEGAGDRDFDPALIDESLALVAAFREIKSPEVRKTLVWLTRSLAQDVEGHRDLLQILGAAAVPPRRARRLS